MHLVMFDIHGTLVESFDFDDECFVKAIEDVLDIKVDSDWSKYTNVSDPGILDEIIEVNNVSVDRDFVHSSVKSKLRDYIADYLDQYGLKQIEGTAEFLSYLKGRPDVKVCLATGGWQEIAHLKLDTAGIDRSGMVLATSSDHYKRIEIMKIAEKRAGNHHFVTKTYFGDRAWDKKASKTLGYNFVLVGSRIQHDKRIDNYTDIKEVLALVGI